jgi:formylglycine-generating enzyme
MKYNKYSLFLLMVLLCILSCGKGPTDAKQLSKPVFSPSAGSYEIGQNITITCATSGAEIRYTLDGTEPNPTSALYANSITINSTTTIKARAYKDGWTKSRTATAIFTISIPLDGLVAYYPFNGNAYDVSGSNNNGTPMFNPVLSTDRFGNSNSCYGFDGIDDYIAVPNSESLNSSQMSICAWVFIDVIGSENRVIVNKYSDSPHEGWSFYLYNGRLEMECRFGEWDFYGFDPNAPVISTGVWHSVVATYDGSYIRTYVDGVLSSQTAKSGAITTSPITMTIGRNSAYSCYFFNGKIDDVRLYNRALSTTEIMQINNEQEIYNDLVFVPGGTFTMGDTHGYGNTNELPTHQVTLSPYYIGKYEVTQSEWISVMGSNPSCFLGDTRRPVERVNWYSMLVYCNKRSMMSGRTPVYSINGSTNPDNWGSIPTSSNSEWNAVLCNWSANGYRLPTESEWEYAARGGTDNPDYVYSGSDNINAVAWWAANSGSTTHAVGQLQSNGLGVFDLSGNVYEFVWDWLGTYDSSPQTNPTGPLTGVNRVARGGSWYNGNSNCSVSYRTYTNLNFGSDQYAGFRVVIGNF